MRRHEQIAQLRKLIARIDGRTTVDAGGFRKTPTRVYVDPELAEREWEAFFRGHPQLIGLSGDLPEPGSFLTLDDLGTPILATRDAQGVFRAFVNACRHRGAVLEERPRGKAEHFVCPFHAWTYRSDGALHAIPRRDHFGDVDPTCRGLIELPAVEWNGLLFVQPDPDASLDVDAMLGDELADELAHWDFARLRHLDDDHYDVACNWKLAMDTFGETYHFTALHRDTLAMTFRGNVQCYDTYGRHHRMLLCLKAIDELRERPESEWRITDATLPVYWLFPNVQLMPSANALYLVRAYPIPGEPGRHTSRVSFYLWPGAEEALERESIERELSIAQAFAQVIRDEDYAMSASQQRTAASGAMSHVLFGRNEPALHHYHSTYRDVLGMKPLPLLSEAEASS